MILERLDEIAMGDLLRDQKKENTETPEPPRIQIKKKKQLIGENPIWLGDTSAIIAVQRKRETRWVHVEMYYWIASDVTRYDTRERGQFHYTTHT